MRSKKASSLAIVAFTFIVISLFAITLFSFVVKERNISTELSNAFIVNDVYSREAIMELYVQDMLDRALNESKTQQELVTNLKKQLNYYKDDGEFVFPYFANFEEQFNTKAVLSGNEAKLENFEIRVKANFYNTKGDKKIIVESYSIKNFTSIKA